MTAAEAREIKPNYGRLVIELLHHITRLYDVGNSPKENTIPLNYQAFYTMKNSIIAYPSYEQSEMEDEWGLNIDGYEITFKRSPCYHTFDPNNKENKICIDCGYTETINND